MVVQCRWLKKEVSVPDATALHSQAFSQTHCVHALASLCHLDMVALLMGEGLIQVS